MEGIQSSNDGDDDVLPLESAENSSSEELNVPTSESSGPLKEDLDAEVNQDHFFEANCDCSSHLSEAASVDGTASVSNGSSVADKLMSTMLVPSPARPQSTMLLPSQALPQ